MKNASVIRNEFKLIYKSKGAKEAREIILNKYGYII